MLPRSASAQRPDDATFVVRLGRDTVAVERFTRRPTLLEGERLVRFPRASLVRYTATLGPDGAITRFESTAVPLLTDSSTASSTVVFGMDSVRVTLSTSQGTRSYAVNPQAAEASVYLPFSFALYEQLVRRTIGRGVDTAHAELVFPGVLNPLPTSIRRIGADSAAIDFFGSPLYLRIDRAGRILGADGSATTQKVTATRERRADVVALAHAFAAREDAEGAPGQLSPRDTARATVGHGEIEIDYGRPSLRGRTILGQVVPWNEVWRTGANAATGFTTTADLAIGGVDVPAGSYSIYSIPGPAGAVLIVNRQTGQWGTEYDPELDVARIPLVQRTLDDPVETFTITLEPAANGAVLRLAWERTEWTVTVAPR